MFTLAVPTPAPADFDSPKADVLVVSSDKVGFPFRRSQLSAASVVFESLFDTASRGAPIALSTCSTEPLQVRSDGSLSVPMSEAADKVELFLRHIGRDLKRSLRLRMDQIEE